MKTGRRVWNCELSTIDSAFLFAACLTCAAYFDGDARMKPRYDGWPNDLYRRADWRWALDGGPALSHGWRPENGFIPHRWRATTRPSSCTSSASARRAFRYRKRAIAHTHRPTNGGSSMGVRSSTRPLVTHQLSQLWIDFRGLRDDFMRERGTDYFANSRQATYVHREYAIHNPHGLAGYGEHSWGITASDGPGWMTRKVGGVERQFYDYIARGAPDGPDDGTLAPWVVLASLPFAPEIVIPTIDHMAQLNVGVSSRYGFKPSFNQTFEVPGARPAGGSRLPLRHRPGPRDPDDRELFARG